MKNKIDKKDLPNIDDLGNSSIDDVLDIPEGALKNADLETPIADSAELDKISAEEGSLINSGDLADFTGLDETDKADTENNLPTGPIVLKCQKCGEEVVEEPICPICGNLLTPLKVITGTKSLTDDEIQVYSTDEEDPGLNYDTDDGLDIYGGLNSYDKELANPYDE